MHHRGAVAEGREVAARSPPTAPVGAQRDITDEHGGDAGLPISADSTRLRGRARCRYPRLMADTNQPRSDRVPSPNAERLRQAMGWDELPGLTDEEHEAFVAATAKARDEAQRFYGQSAA